VTWSVPIAIDDAVRAAVDRVIGAVAPAAVHRAAIARSRRYTSEREQLDDDPIDPDADLAARALLFTIADCMKVAVPLAELASAGALPARDPLRVTDVGAGCGAMTLGVLGYGRRVVAHLIDRDRRALAIAEAALSELGVVATTAAGDARTAALPDADVVVIGSLLNELDPVDRRPLVERALAAIPPDGAVIVVEPALRDTARALHELRDEIIDGGVAHVFAPCTRAIAPCPMRADPRDWCHEERGVALPPRTRDIAHATHLRDGAMKFAYLVVRETPGTLAPGALRVVGHPRAEKGRHELSACGDDGRATIRLLTRHKGDARRDFVRAERGDILAIVPPISAGDLGPDHVVERRRPGAPS
jgi:ribosomal protein RSM22 (predicted rRNA methylase)